MKILWSLVLLEGKVWLVKFTPNDSRVWSYEVSFKKGDNLTVNAVPYKESRLMHLWQNRYPQSIPSSVSGLSRLVGNDSRLGGGAYKEEIGRLLLALK